MHHWEQMGLGANDIVEVERIVSESGGNINNLWYRFNKDAGELEAYEGTISGTLRVTSVGDGVWTEQ